MSSEIIESYFIFNGQLLPAANAEAHSKGPSATIYEVIRVVSGIPLFLEKHIQRLEASAKLLGFSIEPIRNDICTGVRKLIKANNNPEKNIRIIVYHQDDNAPAYMACFIHSSYPTPEEYQRGVHGTLLKEERSNPNAKVINSSFKERVAASLAEAGAYEALLVNSANEITEGSRSNVFFVKNHEVLTAPKGDVLIGITRICVFELCEKLGIAVTEKPVDIEMLKDIDGVFMTGTSPKILPLCSIDAMSFKSAENHIVKMLINAYSDLVAEYLKVNKKNIG